MLALALFFTLICDGIEDGWKGIRPLHSDRSAVEKVLGKAKIAEDGDYVYLTDDAVIRVNYSNAPCQAADYGRGKYKVAEGTVLDYVVNFRNDMRLRDLSFQRDKYIRDTSGDVINFVSYVNLLGGVTASVTVEENVEFVTSLRYRATKVDESKFLCK